MASDDRPAGTGEQVREEYGEGQQSPHHQTQ